VYWKALHFDFRQSRSRAGLIIARIIFALSFAPVGVALAVLAMDGFRGVDIVLNILCRILATAALCGMAVIVASNASASIGRERNKRTLDELLLTDLTTDEILTQKWWACVVVIRWGVVWVAIHWLLGVLTGGLHILAIPVLILEWVVYVTFAASLGMYFAARMYTAQGANGGTGLVGFGLGVLPLMIGLLVRLVSDRAFIYLYPIFVSPPAVLGAAAFSPFDLDQKQHSVFLSILAPVIAGTLVSMVIYVVLARKLWHGARWWFPRMVGRR
jgi:hypothetical protein